MKISVAKMIHFRFQRILPPSNHFTPIRFIQYDIMFENLWDNQEFQAIVKRDHEEKAAIRAQIKEMEERGELDK